MMSRQLETSDSGRDGEVKNVVLMARCLKCAYSDRGEESRSGRAQVQVAEWEQRIRRPFSCASHRLGHLRLEKENSGTHWTHRPITVLLQDSPKGHEPRSPLCQPMPALCGKITAGIGLVQLLFLGGGIGSQCTVRWEHGNRHALGLIRSYGGENQHWIPTCVLVTGGPQQ